jgi:hypothetical protein
MPRPSDTRRQGSGASRSAFGVFGSLPGSLSGRQFGHSSAGWSSPIPRPFPRRRESSPEAVLQPAERWLPAFAGMTAVAYRCFNLWKSLCPGRLALTFDGLCQTPSGMGRAAATFAGDAEIAPQVFQVAGASRGGFADLAVGDGHADADIHGDSPGKQGTAEVASERAVTRRRFPLSRRPDRCVPADSLPASGRQSGCAASPASRWLLRSAPAGLPGGRG